MENRYYLTKYERSILKILWKENRPLTYAEIKEMLNGQFNQIHRVLNSLMEKELIYVSGFVGGRKNARQFSASLTEDEFMTNMLESDLEDEKTLEKVTMALVKKLADRKDKKRYSKEDNEKFIADLENMVEKYKNMESE